MAAAAAAATATVEMATQTDEARVHTTPPAHGTRVPEKAKLLLASRRLRCGETLRDLAGDLLRLAQCAYPNMCPASQNEIARDRLLVEIEDPLARKLARCARPPTLETVLRVLEAHRANSTTTAGGGDSPPAPASPDSPKTPVGGAAAEPATTATTTTPPASAAAAAAAAAAPTAADMHALTAALRETTAALRQFMAMQIASGPTARIPAALSSGVTD